MVPFFCFMRQRFRVERSKKNKNNNNTKKTHGARQLVSANQPTFLSYLDLFVTLSEKMKETERRHHIAYRVGAEMLRFSTFLHVAR